MIKQDNYLTGPLKTQQALSNFSRNISQKRQRTSETAREANSKHRKVNHQEEYKCSKVNHQLEAGRSPKNPSLPNPSSISVSKPDTSPSSALRKYVQRWLENTATPSHNRRSFQNCSPGTMARSNTSSNTSSRKRRRLDNEDYNVDATSKPRRHGKLSKETEPAFSQTDSATNGSSQSNRSASPVKKITDMRFFSNPVVMKLFDDFAEHIRDDLWKIHRQIHRFSRGIGVISASSRDDIRSRLERSFRIIDDDAFGETELPTPSAAGVAHLVGHAQTCDKKGHGEASWNCMVHSPLLDMALCECGYRIGFLNCTTSRIQPTELIPTNHLGQVAESKMVDFAIYLEEDPELIKAMKTMTTRHRLVPVSINQTFDPPLCTSPITISIETKKPGIEWETAMVQVGIWAAAQFSKLEQLLEDSGHGVDEARQCLPFLPLFVVQGHDWSFLAATRESDGETRIWSKVMIGSTTAPLGVYQIVSTLQLLAKWSEEVYRPWFWKYALGVEA